MYVVKNKEGHMMMLMHLPATPPYTAYFGPNVTVEFAEKYMTEEEACHDMVWLIRDQEEPASKFEGCTFEKLSES